MNPLNGAQAASPLPKVPPPHPHGAPLVGFCNVFFYGNGDVIWNGTFPSRQAMFSALEEVKYKYAQHFDRIEQKGPGIEVAQPADIPPAG